MNYEERIRELEADRDWWDDAQWETMGQLNAVEAREREAGG